jgi:hypothetical protein
MPGLWNYLEYLKTTEDGFVISGINVLKSAANEIERQLEVAGENEIVFIQTLIFNEPDAMNSQGTNLLTQEQVTERNRSIFNEICSLPNFIRKYLIGGRLSGNDVRLNDNEKALGMMFMDGWKKEHPRKDFVRMLKMAQLFLDKFCSGGDNIDSFLFHLHKCLCITQVGTRRLTAQQAAQQKLELGHKHHYLGDRNAKGKSPYDVNPLNMAFRNHDVNCAQKSCSLYFCYRMGCQCPPVHVEPEGGVCHPRCHVLTEDYFEQEVQVELVSIGGLFPTANEVDIRSNIRDAFIRHCERHNYPRHDYLLDDNRAALLTPKYPDLETLRKRFDINDAGQGLYDERQDEYVTFDSIFNPTIPASERKHLPKGFLNDLEKQLRKLTMPFEPNVSATPADTSTLLRSGINKKSANDLNRLAFQRMKMMPKAIRMLLTDDLTSEHKDMTYEEKLAGALVSGYLELKNLKGDPQKMTNHNDATGCFLPRLMKTIRDFIDHSEHWKENPEDPYPSVQKYLNHLAVKSPVGRQISQVLAAAQEFEASHTNHLRSTKANRDLNPQHMWLENKHRNQAHGICALFPEIPCRDRCQCHERHKCNKCFFKLDDEYVFDRAVLESQLGLFGRYGLISYVEARARIVDELKAVFVNANKDVPNFLLFMEDNPTLHPSFRCEKCNTRFPTIREREECCPEVDEVEEQDVVTREQLEGSDEKMTELLRAMLLYGVQGRGVCDWTRPVLAELSFPTTKDTILGLLRPNWSAPAQGYPYFILCESFGISVDTGDGKLLLCEGARSGCPCELHEIELDD